MRARLVSDLSSSFDICSFLRDPHFVLIRVLSRKIVDRLRLLKDGANLGEN